MLKKFAKQWVSVLAVLAAPALAAAEKPGIFLLDVQQDEAQAAPDEKPAAEADTPAAAPPDEGEEPAPAPPEGEATPPAAPKPPAAADGVAHVGKCGAAGKCGPAGCGPAGCRSGACSTGAVPGMICGACSGRGCNGCNGLGTVGGCLPGCQSHAGGPCSCGMVNALCNNPFLCSRPYTIGDLKCDLHNWKCNVRHELRGECDTYGGGAFQSWWANEMFKYRCRRRYRNAVLEAHFKNKMNYFVPSGGDGRGVPLYGTYSRVYAVQPDYFDPRDAQVYASPHTGVPTVIPIAPGVRHQYNYSWGIPSSRITPLYNVMKPSRK